MLLDNVKGRQLQNDGTYRKRMGHAKRIDSQQYFIDSFSVPVVAIHKREN